MPPKQKVPAPIDRPLSRAYLREFKGWSTAYPPGMSDPTSLRVMENILINRDGSAAIRPGLRSLTPTYKPALLAATMPEIVGSFETFYLADGSRAYLFARRGAERVEFFVAEVEADGSLTIVDLNTHFDVTPWSFAGEEVGFTLGTTYVEYVQIDNRILALSNNGERAILFFVGATKKVAYTQTLAMPTGDPLPVQTDTYLTTPDWLTGPQTTYPPGGLNNTADSLSSSTNPNPYNIAFTITFGNEFGESTPSGLWSTRVQRPWGAWRREGPVAINPGDAPHPNGVPVTDPKKAADHIILRVLSETLFNDAIEAGATSLNVYMMTWSDQTAVPVEMQRILEKPLSTDSSWNDDGYAHIHPGLQPLGPTIPIPTKDNIRNTSAAPAAGQGLVASDRLVLVNDPTDAASIRWTTNQQGNYLDFSGAVGGGFKTLTTGNLQIPACVKLWQNPQSVDTLTVLCMGDDGMSSAYYMAPAAVTSQSDNTTVMGFEETTATPGTTSPYGCEVANNALYHPLDDQLMKSTASNYNINHKSMTDQIFNRWQPLADKKKIVSCFYDQRLYFLVHNPDGAELEAHCNGNEVWVLDLAAEGGSWSRWLVQAVSLRKIERLGKVHLGVVRPDGFYIFDDEKADDDYYDDGTGSWVLTQRSIPWSLETNIQGANRSHDAWCHLQQANLTVGNFVGTMRYGIRSKDRHGRIIEKAKLLRQLNAAPAERFDIEDMLLVKADLREWFFFAESVEDEGVVRPSYGQLNLVQYRYTPISVNQDYEEGSVETFEYGRDTVNWTDRNTLNGVTIPRADTGSP